MGLNNWRSIFFWKTVASDYRIEAYVSTSTLIHPDGTPHWYIRGDRTANTGGNYKEDWVVRNTDISVPIGKWFMVEFYWHRSTHEEGRIFWAVNGQVIADHKGSNLGNRHNHINRISPFGVYTRPAVYPARQWIDDVEIWDDFPCGDGLSCYNHKEPELLNEKAGK